MNYYEEYQDCFENDKPVFSKVKEDVIKEIMAEKNALMIFYDNIDLCRQKLGETPVVAKMLYSLYEYDKTLDKKTYKTPDFSGYDKGEMADVIFQVMLNAAYGNFEKYITGIMQRRYNGSKNSSKNKEGDTVDYNSPNFKPKDRWR